MKARLVCPKCGKPLVAAVTRVKDETTGQEHRRVHYHCQDRSCDGKAENPTELRAFVRPAPQVTPLGRWLAEHRRRSWRPAGPRPSLAGGFARLSPRGPRCST